MHGLVRFLGIEPFFNQIWWQRAIVNPLATNNSLSWLRVVSLFRYFMWRHTMHDVQSELHLPHKVEHVHHVSFTPIEKHFYETLLRDIRQKMNLNSDEIAFRCLLQLRQACCHPQIAIRDHHSSKKDRFNVSVIEKPLLPSSEAPRPSGRSTNAPMSLPELYNRMMMLARKELTDEQRILVMHLHAKAGLLMLKEDFKEAQSVYERVLQLSDSNEAKFDAPIDTVQKLHALNGLLDIVKQQKPTEGINSQRIKLENEVTSIKEHILSQQGVNLEAAYNECLHAKEMIESKNASPYWWVDALKFIQEYRDGGRRVSNLIRRLKLPVLEGGACTNDANFSGKIACVSSADGLQMILVSELDKQSQCYDDLLESISRIRSSPTSEEILKSSDCFSCRGYRGRKGEICPNCAETRYLDCMEDMLFSYRRKKRAVSDNQENGKESLPATRTRKKRGEGGDTGDSQAFQEPSAIIHTLRLIANTIKSIPQHDMHLLDEYRKHQEYLSLVGNLLHKARELWKAKDFFLKEYDVVDQNCMRMQCASDDEEIDEENSGWQVYRDEIPARLILNENDVLISEEKLRGAVSKVSYLRTIEGAKEGTVSDNICISCFVDNFNLVTSVQFVLMRLWKLLECCLAHISFAPHVR